MAAHAARPLLRAYDVKRVVAVLVLASAFVACAKEEWNQNQIGVGNPISQTDETEPAADDAVDAPVDSATVEDAAVDAPAGDARTDARDATAG